MRRVRNHTSPFAPALVLALAFCALPVALLPAVARADEPSWIVKEGPHPNTVALEMNPASIAIGRFAATIEYVLATHHVALITPHYYWAFPAPSDRFDGGGLELGYRYYSGRRGTDGLFLGAVAMYGDYRFKHAVQTRFAPDGTVIDGANETDFKSYGGALDVGYKRIVWDTFAIGAGGGVAYTFTSDDPLFTSGTREKLLYGGGLRPRVILEVGGAF